MRGLTVLAALLVTGAVAPPAAEGGESLPAGAVVQVGDRVISKQTFQRWLRTAARGEYADRAVPDPPRFERCSAALRRSRSGGDGSPAATRRLREICAGRYRDILPEVLQFLIQGLWVRGEASERGIVVSEAQVARFLRRTKRVAFETEREFRRFISRSGLRPAQLRYRFRLDLLQDRLAAQVAAAAPKPTDEEVEAYYQSNRRDYRGRSRESALRFVRRRLLAENQQREIDRFLDDWRRHWTAQTVCSPRYVAPECGSYSAISSSTSYWFASKIQTSSISSSRTR